MQLLQFAEEAQTSGVDVSGVKGVSALYLVPDFNIVSGFNPEYMHSVLLGVVRQFVNLWFDSSSSGKPYCLRKDLAVVDNIILNAKPPSEIKRLPRSLTLRHYWKASEWRSFLLFYSVVALKPVMPQQLYNHWLLLAFAIYSLLGRQICRSDLLACDLALHNFVILVPQLYGTENVSFNVHLLTHIVMSVKQWGPLWASSAFVFEDANRQLLRYFHGSNAVSQQIFKSYILSKHLKPLAERYVTEKSDAAVCQLFSRLSHVKVQCENVTRVADGVVGIGVCRRSCSLSVPEIMAVESLLGTATVTSHVYTFDRVIVNGMVMHTVNYSSRIKRSDCYFTLHNHSGIYALQRCVCFAGLNEIFFLFRYFCCQQQRCYNSSINMNLLRHVVKACQHGFHVVACRAADIRQKCIGVTNGRGHLFCICLPIFELD